LKQKLSECRDNKRNFPTVPIDGTIVSLQGMMLDNKYLYEKCREDSLAPNSLVKLKINHPSNNGKYIQKCFKLVHLIHCSNDMRIFIEL
jgi:hypothetical protein